jgi:2-(1,2-epoxy-1,2-dihydrophenyl)acetyl-CoA isomerase
MVPKDFESILFDIERDSGVVTVTINCPEIRNALTLRVLLELYWAVDAFENDSAAKAMILTGAANPESNDPADEAFSSGGYFNPAELEAMDDDIKEQIDLSDIAQKKLCLKMWDLHKPVIAAINGLAIGGGFTVPLACADLIYASEHAWVKLPFVRIGITPELASSYLLPRLIGFQRAKEIFFFGEKKTALELEQMGLINGVLPHDKLLPHVRNIAASLIAPRGAELAVRWTKQIMHRSLIEAVTRSLDQENEALTKALGSADFWEALAARAGKRAPVFKGQ